MKAFKAPRKSLGNLDADSAAAVISAAADVALVLDASGVIHDVAFNSEDLAAEFDGQASWLGRAWAEIVTDESRRKVEALLREAGTAETPRWRQLNHLATSGESIPVLYAAVQVGSGGRAVAFGRDLRPVSALQQRLVAAQQAMERDYAKLRQVEARYRLLFEMSAEPVLILDGTSLRVQEANGAARRLLERGGRRGPGTALAELFAAESQGAVQALLASVRTGARADEVRARLADATAPESGQGREVDVAASLFRQDQATLFLVRLGLAGADGDSILLPRSRAALLRLVENAPDGIVIVRQDGAITSANAAFLDMVQMATEEQVRGQALSRWLGRQGVELEVLIGNLKARGPVRMFTTTLRGEYGATLDVELAAVSFTDGGEPAFGFAIRDVGMRAPIEPARGGAVMPRSMEQLTELIGRVPLKDLVREATDVIERMCIEAALQMTNDNRASAAEMLGLSRQSLYVKLRRYSLADGPADAGDGPAERG